ncbi:MULTISPECIES: UDP-N-acetylmuramate--L-alanine ligase [unclassified Nitrospina]|uniref:UDP-N-acetylmuramate--L-alanine ligase n=1 Tax=unclassified Nitrospina TaxID=2638683 RepID=UPI003F9B1259
MFLGKTRRIHFIGIGGAGMSGIAEVLINQGYDVTGSDLARSTVTEHLEKAGATIHYGHAAENVADCQVVVTSSAVKADNVEVKAAREQSVPVIRRAEMLAELMRMKYGIAIAGTHGKTTTTSLVGTLLAGGELDPTVVIGGKLKSVGSHAQLGQSEFLVAEADESDGSFLKLMPTVVVVTTLDEEHMEYYGTLDTLKEAFLNFINKVPFYGTAVLCLDEVNIQSLIPHVEKRAITYGLTSQADYTARNIRFKGLDTWFDVFHHGKALGTLHSVAPGRHNVLNTLAAVAVAMELNLTFDTIADALKQFRGVQRRFEIIHDTEPLVVVDDYGHHPVEIQATLRTVREVWPERRMVVVFQPHRYSRTRSLMQEFWSSFHNADCVIVNDIYAAGEDPVAGVTAGRMVEGIKNFGHKHVEYIADRKTTQDRLNQLLQPGDVLLTLGAGNIWELGRELIANLPARLRGGDAGKDSSSC